MYFGDLAPVFAQVHAALRPAGYFSFSVEESANADFVLTATNRYRHSLRYLQHLADTIGFTMIEAVARPLRTERNTEVRGYVVLMRRVQ